MGCPVKKIETVLVAKHHTVKTCNIPRVHNFSIRWGVNGQFDDPIFLPPWKNPPVGVIKYLMCVKDHISIHGRETGLSAPCTDQLCGYPASCLMRTNANLV